MICWSTTDDFKWCSIPKSYPKMRPNPGCLWHLSIYETITVILWLLSSDICFILATAATCFSFFFCAGFYDASVKQAGFIEFSYIIYFYQTALLICGSRLTIVRTIPVHNVGEYFIQINLDKWKNCCPKGSLIFKSTSVAFFDVF